MNAQRIYETRSRQPAPGSHFPAYYMVNLAHPAMLDLYKRWCQQQGIPAGMPPADRERIAFELSLLRPEIIDELSSYADWVEGQRAALGDELLDHLRGGGRR